MDGAHLSDLIKLLGGPFGEPVDYVQLCIPDYPKIIKQPMDLGTILEKLRSKEYRSVDEWIADMRLVFSNACTFNPPEDPVHQMANTLSAFFEGKLSKCKFKTRNLVSVPPAEVSEWIRNAQHLIRSVRALPEAYPFNEPVDYEKLGIPDYPMVIERPMDLGAQLLRAVTEIFPNMFHLGTVEENLSRGHFKSLDKFASAVRLVFRNAKKYNTEESQIYELALTTEQYFEDALFTLSGKRTGGIRNEKRPREANDWQYNIHDQCEPTAEELARSVTMEEMQEL